MCMYVILRICFPCFSAALAPSPRIRDVGRYSRLRLDSHCERHDFSRHELSADPLHPRGAFFRTWHVLGTEGQMA